MDARNELLQSRFVSTPPRKQQPRDVVRRLVPRNAGILTPAQAVPCLSMARLKP